MTILIHNTPNTMTRTASDRSWKKNRFLHFVLFMFVAVVITGCSDDDDDEVMTTESMTTDSMTTDPVLTTRDSGMRVTVQDANGVTVHTLTAPESAFANSTHLVETENSLVAFDTQFLLPNATDMRAYATEIGKPIARLFITHDHPDHFLGSEAFNDLPIFALQEVSDLIAQNGDAEVAEKQADFPAGSIADTYVVPEILDPTVDYMIDGVTFEFERVVDAEASFQLVTRVPNHGVVITGDVVYSGVHLILAGQIGPWTTALNNLAAGDGYPIVLAGHGVPAVPSVYEVNVSWLAKAGELLAAGGDFDTFKQGLIDAFPDLTMTAAIDFVKPFLFPDEE